jgi:hypothetical protein
MKKKMAQIHRRPWFLWIGGACFLVGSILFSTIGLASSAGPPNQTVTANQGSAGGSPWPVSGNVGISGSLPAGSNDIGTVHVAAPTPVITEANCQVADSSQVCSAQITTALPTGTIVNTLSVSCEVLSGQPVEVNFEANANFHCSVPLTLSATAFGFDHVIGTLTNLGIPIQNETENFLIVSENYSASSGNGASCEMTFTGTTS